MKHLFVKGHKHSKETKRKLAIQKIGEKNPMWKGGKWLDDGYYRLSQFNGRFEHRVVMENFIGRKLKRSEHVHHINFNKQDNRLENLMVVSNFEHKNYIENLISVAFVLSLIEQRDCALFIIINNMDMEVTVSYYRDQLERWLGQIQVSADSVLDVGGGEKPIKDRVASWDVKKYRILDNDAQFRPDIFGDLNYIIDIDTPYDVLFCLEVFEYVWNPVQAIENLSDFLKPGGIAYISFPTIYPLHNPPGMDYLRYTKNGVEKLLARANFNWEITPRVASLGKRDLAQFYHNEQMHPIRGTDEIFDIGYLVKGVKI